MQDVGSQECGDLQGIQERERDPVQELAEKLNVTGEEKYVEEVMKARGMDIKNGAVTIVTSVGNGRVRHQRRQLWEHYPPQPADEGGGCRCDTETECRVVETDMAGRRAGHGVHRGVAGQLGGGLGHDHRGGVGKRA